MATKLISVHEWGNCYVLELQHNDSGLTGTVMFHRHDHAPQRHSGPHRFSSVDRARQWMSEWAGSPITEEDLIARTEKLFPEGADVVMIRRDLAGQLRWAYQIPGYDVVWTGPDRQSRDLPRVAQLQLPGQMLIIRIPEDGQVRCSEEFFGRVIGRKGVKINELSKKHGRPLRLVRV